MFSQTSHTCAGVESSGKTSDQIRSWLIFGKQLFPRSQINLDDLIIKLSLYFIINHYVNVNVKLLCT